MGYYQSHGAGVDSTALSVLLCEGPLAHLRPLRVVFADTGDERDETYHYIENVIVPYLARHGLAWEVVRDRETVLARWERLAVVGSRTLRTCTSHAKIRPIEAWLAVAADSDAVQLLGIDADEPHRARPGRSSDPYAKRYPLVELGLGRRACREIILRAGLCVPPKSGCWHCPFLRKRQVLDLAREHPGRFARIEELEAASLDVHPVDPGKVRAQWGERPASAWRALAEREAAQGRLLDLGPDPEDAGCGCYDG